MKVISNRILRVIGICAALLVTIAFDAFSAEETIKFGVVDVFSGGYKRQGVSNLDGIKAAVAEINATGGLLGKQIEILIEDNQFDPQLTVHRMKKLVLQDGCEVIFIGSGSHIATAAAKAMPELKKILIVSPEAMAITGEFFTPYTFRTYLNVGMHVKGLAKYAALKGYKKMFLLNQDYSFGYDCAKYFELFYKEYMPEGEIVGKRFHKLNTEDIRPFIAEILASDADAVFTGNWGKDQKELVLRGRQMGMNLPIFGLYLDDVEVLPVIGKHAIGGYAASIFLNGLETPRAKELEENFLKYSGGKTLTMVGYMGYLQGMLYIEAVKKAGVIDTEQVIAAFEGLEWEGALGTITMRKEDHQAQHPVVIGQVVEKTPYYDFPYHEPREIIPAEEVSVTLEESGWRPYTEE